MKSTDAWSDSVHLPEVDTMRQKVLKQCNRLGNVTVYCNSEVSGLTTVFSYSPSSQSKAHCSSKLTVNVSLPSATLLTLAQSALPQHASTMLQLYCEIAVKWVLNAITTGAHVLKGKVLRNYMVDLQVR